MKRRAFTLAEIMIVLVIVGIMVSLLLSAARNITPNEQIIRFKKMHNLLFSAINELTTSDKYFYEGNLSKMPDGSDIVDSCHFINALGDIINARKVVCNSSVITIDPIPSCTSDFTYNNSANLINFKTNTIDGSNDSNIISKIITRNNGYITLSKNISIIAATPCDSSCNCKDENDFNTCYSPIAIVFDYDFGDEINNNDVSQIDALINGTQSGIKPLIFSYALRNDGKIIPGMRPDEWLKKSVQEKE